MATSLAKQLTNLQRKQTIQPTHLTAKLTPSVLFELKSAGKISIEKIQELAMEGFHNLKPMIPELVNYQDLIFSSEKMDRMKLTPSENTALSEKIKEVLTFLSTNLLNINTLRILELFLRKFEIHNFESTELIVYFLAFHGTAPYVKLLQNVDLTSKNSRFFFMNSAVRRGDAFPREFLCRQCAIDPSIISLYVDFFEKFKNLVLLKNSENQIFVSQKMKNDIFKSPVVPFLTSLLTETLALSVKNAKRVQDLRLLNLKFIAKVLDGRSTIEEISSCVIIFCDIIALGLLEKSEEIEAILLDIWDGIKSMEKPENFVKSFSKFLIYVFQNSKNLEVNEKLLNILETDSIFENILKSEFSLISLVLKIFKFSLEKNLFNDKIEKLFSHIFKTESYLQENETARKEFVMMILNMVKIEESSAQKTVKLLKNSLEDEFYEILSIYVGKIGEENTEKFEFFEKILNENEIFRLVQIGEASKMSVVAALKSTRKSTKVKALEILKNADFGKYSEKMKNRLLNEILTNLKNEENPETIKKLLELIDDKTDDKTDKFSEEIEEIIFKKFIFFESETLKNYIEQTLKSKSQNLIHMIDYYNLITSKSTLAEIVEIPEEKIEKIISKIFEVKDTSNLDIYRKFIHNSILNLKTHIQYEKLTKYFSEEKIDFSLEQNYLNQLSFQFEEIISDCSEKTFIQILSLIKTFRNLFEENFNPTLKNPVQLMKMIFKIYLRDVGNKTELEFDLETANDLILTTSAFVLDSTRKKTTQIDMNFKVEDLIFNSLAILLKSIFNADLQNLSFIKILQFSNYAISAKEKEKGGLAKNIFNNMFKIIIKNNLLFESSPYELFTLGKNVEILKNSIFGKDKKIPFKIFVNKFQDFCFSSGLLMEYLQFFELVEKFEVKKNTKKFFDLINSTFANSNNIEYLFEELQSRDEFEQNLIRKILKIFFFLKISNSEKSEEIEDLIKEFGKNGVFNYCDAEYVNRFKSHSLHHQIVFEFFKGNSRIEDFENLDTVPELLCFVSEEFISGEKVEFSQEKHIRNFFSFIMTNYSAVDEINQETDPEQFILLLKNLQKFDNFSLKTTSRLFKVISNLILIVKNSQSVELIENFRNISKNKMKQKILKNELIGEELKITGYISKKKKIYIEFEEILKIDFLKKFEKKILSNISTIIESSTDTTDLSKSSEIDDSIFDFKIFKNFLEMILRAEDHLFHYSKEILTKITKSLDNHLKELKEKLFNKKGKNVLSEKFNSLPQSLEDKSSLALTKISKEIDFLYTEILKIISENFKKRKISLSSNILYSYLKHCEEYRSDGILRLLSSFYKKMQKKIYFKEKNFTPFSDEKIWQFCSFLKNVINSVFKEANVYIVVKILFAFYMNYGSQRSTSGDKNTNPSFLQFDFFCHFLSKFLINVNFFDSNSEERASNITKTLIKGLKNLKGMIPCASKKSRKNMVCKILRKILSREKEQDGAILRIRSARLTLFYLTFLKYFLKKSYFSAFLTKHIFNDNEQYENSELILDLELLMNAGFEFDIEIERVEILIKVKKSSEKSLKIFEKLKQLCKENVEIIGKFIPIEIFPIFIKKRLEKENEEKLETLSRFTNSFVDRIPNAKLSPQFKKYFEDSFENFVKKKKFEKDKKSKLQFSKFVQSYFTSLALVRKKLPSFTERLVSKKYKVLFDIIKEQKNGIIELGCISSLSEFSRNINEEFVGNLKQYMKLLLDCTFKIILKSDEPLFDAVYDNYNILFTFTKFNFMKKFKKENLNFLKENKKIHSSYKNKELPGLTLLTFNTLVKNLRNTLEPYIEPLLVSSMFLTSLHRKNSKNIFEEILENLSENVSLSNLVNKVGRVFVILDKEFVGFENVEFLNFFFEKMLTCNESKDMVDIRNEVYSSLMKILKILFSKYKKFLDEENNDDNNIYETQIELCLENFVIFGLKCSEKNFKKYFEKMLKWSKLTQNYSSDDDISMKKKITLVKFLNKFVSKIGRFGINYYGYIFDYYIGFLEHIKALLTEESHIEENPLKKRTKSSSPSQIDPNLISLNSEILNSLYLLFAHDKMNYVDTIKFEKIVKPLASQFQLWQLSPEYFSKYTEKYTSPAVLALFNLINDEYMLKTLQFNILKDGVKHEIPSVRVSCAKLMLKVVDLFQERYIVILNDFIPFLAEMLDDEESEVNVVARKVMKALETCTGEDIVRMIREMSF